MAMKNFTSTRELQRLVEAYRFDASEDLGFSLISGAPIEMNSEAKKTKENDDAIKQWMHNPFAFSIVERMIDFALGEGFLYSCEDEKFEEMLTRFICSPANDLKNRIFSVARSHIIFGETIVKPYVSTYSGDVSLAFLYAPNITRVDDISARTYRARHVWYAQDTEPFAIIERDKDGLYDGDVFLFMRNELPHKHRGTSELASYLDDLRNYQRMIKVASERIGLSLAFVYDIEIANASKVELKKRESEIQQRPPRSGNAYVHNQNEKWDIKSANTGGADLSQAFRFLSSTFLAGSSTPEHFLGLGGDVNRATALAMNSPYYRKIKREQRIIKNMLETLIDYQIAMWKSKGVLTDNDNCEYAISLPEPDKEIGKTVAETLSQLSTSIATLVNTGVMDVQTARRLVSIHTEQLGVVQEEKSDEDLEIDAYESARKVFDAVGK